MISGGIEIEIKKIKYMKGFLFIIISFISISSFGQNYMQAIGVRGGTTSGITYRQKMDENKAYEGILTIRDRGMIVTALRTKCTPRSKDYSDNLFFCVGYGIHGGFEYTNRYRFMVFGELIYPTKKMTPLLGVDGYLGMEYRIKELPFIFGLDYKPYIEFSTRQFFNMNIGDVAFAVKYRF